MAEQQKDLRAVRYCFTENTMEEPAWDPLHMKYLVYQTETAPATGHLHIQGYVRFNERTRVKRAREILRIPKAHMEVCKGTEEQNRAYCTKEESRAPGPSGEYGTYERKQAGQGTRTDLNALKEAAKAPGATLSKLAESFGDEIIRYPAGVQLYYRLVQPPVDPIRPIRVVWMWGPTSQGKTYRAFQQHPNLYTVTFPHPWDSYQGEQVILMDEFNSANWQITDLNRILDQYKYELSCRYQNKMARWNLVIICSNADPMTFYTEAHVDQRLLDAFRRRVTDVYHVTDREAFADLSLPPMPVPVPPPPSTPPSDQAPGLNEAEVATAPSSPVSSPDLLNL